NGSPRGQGHDWRYQQDSQQRPYQQLPESLRQQLEELSGEELESTPWMVNRDMLYNYYYRRMNLLA
ncbi:MAG: hypothetical protein ACOCZ3_00245, partial [Bacillota bacterium]